MNPVEVTSVVLASSEAQRFMREAETAFVNGELGEAIEKFGAAERWANRCKVLADDRKRRGKRPPPKVRQ